VHVTEASVTMVAVDEDGQPTPLMKLPAKA